jgi:hypothetical protein
VLERRAVQVLDLQAEVEAFPEGSAIARELGHRTILAVLLIREKMPLCAIVLRRDKVEPFSDKQIELVTTFADQAVMPSRTSGYSTRCRHELEGFGSDRAFDGSSSYWPSSPWSLWGWPELDRLRLGLTP